MDNYIFLSVVLVPSLALATVSILLPLTPFLCLWDNAMLDFNKPIATRSGRSVRILCTDLDSPYPVAVYIKGWGVYTFDLNGKNGADSEVLINVPKVIYEYRNVYPSAGPCKSWNSLSEAINSRAGHFTLGILKMKFIDEVFDSAIFIKSGEDDG